MPPFPTPPDIVSVLLFGVWIVYTLIAGSERMQRKSVVGLMNNHRSRWMAEMLRRDPRMVDTFMILNHLQGGIAEPPTLVGCRQFSWLFADLARYDGGRLRTVSSKVACTSFREKLL